jgi:hypothetical protein
MARPRRSAQAAEERTEEAIVVRQVTHLQASWSERERGGPGALTFQLILDNGADEHILSVTAEDADNLFDWLHASTDVYYDLERRVLMFGTREVGA